MELPPLQLRKNEDRRLRAGHLWVFSNEVDTAATPLNRFEPGQPVRVLDSRGAFVGNGYVNPHSLICARLVSHDPSTTLDDALIRARIGRALALRELLYPGEPYYRLIFGEGDHLPGLVVDRFGGSLVAQITTAGVDRLTPIVVDALLDVPGTTGLVLRNDTPARGLEGLDQRVETFGTVPDRVELVENRARFTTSLTSGQKTGWFYDHRANRAALAKYVGGRRVLDVFSYGGGWGIQAAVAGARSVVCVDASAAALEDVERSAALSGVEARVATRRSDAFDALAELASAGEKFDVVVLDPPAFVKRRKDLKQGERAYRRVNRLAMDVLAPDGILVSASCSFHMTRDALLNQVLRASRDAGRELQVLEEGHQAPDHPVHPAIPETAYLKSFISRVA